MGRLWAGVVMCLSLGVAPVCLAQLPDIPYGRLAIELQSIVIDSGIEQPLQLTNAGDGSGRLFIAEAAGVNLATKQQTAILRKFAPLDTQVTGHRRRLDHQKHVGR